MTEEEVMKAAADGLVETYTAGLLQGLRALRESSPPLYGPGLLLAQQFIEQAKDLWMRTGS